jgi:hypothetical protein
MWKLIWGGGARVPFTPLERRLLQVLEQHLEGEARRRFAAQLKAITLVQRHEREVCCYPMVRGKPHHDPAICFANDAEEVKLATIHFHLPPSEARCKAEFYAVRGHFFSIVFQPKVPRRSADEPVLIDRVKLHLDSMEPVAAAEPSLPAVRSDR